jgi:hypothetical protein
MTGKDVSGVHREKERWIRCGADACGRGVVYDRAARERGVVAYRVEQAQAGRYRIVENRTYPSTVAVVDLQALLRFADTASPGVMD